MILFSTYSLYLHYHCCLSVLRPPVISVLILVRIKLSFSPSSLVVYKESGAGRAASLRYSHPGHPALSRTGPRHIWPGQDRDREVRKSRGDKI